MYASITSKVSTRLAAGFGVVIASALILAAFGSLRLHTVESLKHQASRLAEVVGVFKLAA